MSLKKLIYNLLKMSNDVNAVQRKKVRKRVKRRVAGKVAGRMMRRL